MRILYPSDYFERKKADEHFRSEADAFARAGADWSTINLDELGKARPYPDFAIGETVMYRGWMLNELKYKKLVSAVTSADAGFLIDLDTYLQTHHLPNWYKLLSDLTPETVVLPLGSDFASELDKLGWKSFFVKDFVKSLKTSMGAVITKPGQIMDLMNEMEKFRGEIEGGLCIRRVEDLVANSEVRYFVWKGKPFSSVRESIPRIVFECAERITSPFFSVDVAKRSDGADRVVEIGDGQVSDLVGWPTNRFVEIFSNEA
ncbi:MAG: ATP-grasp domain-containing protein [Pseudomonadota bacterium]